MCKLLLCTFLLCTHCVLTLGREKMVMSSMEVQPNPQPVNNLVLRRNRPGTKAEVSGTVVQWRLELHSNSQLHQVDFNLFTFDKIVQNSGKILSSFHFHSDGNFFMFSLSQEFCKWPDEHFEEMDSTLVVQQYIQQLIRKDHTNVEFILTMPDGQDEGVWKYEHLR